MRVRCSNPVVAVCVPNDVYLTYSISILTSVMRITSFPLNLRSDSPSRSSKELPLDDDITSNECKSHWFTPVKDTPPHASYIGPQPFVPPPILSRPFGLPSNPRLALPGPASPDKDQPKFMLTPDTMRYLGTTVAKFTTQINEVLVANKDTDRHVALQMQEFKSQQVRCKEMFTLVENLKGPRHDKTQERMEKVQQMQKILLGRLDRLLQSLMEKASPELSEYETKWFEELKRMKEDIMGAGRYDEGSLAARTKLVCSLFFLFISTDSLIFSLNSWRESMHESCQVSKYCLRRKQDTPRSSQRATKAWDYPKLSSWENAQIWSAFLSLYGGVGNRTDFWNIQTSQNLGGGKASRPSRGQTSDTSGTPTFTAVGNVDS